ncbi:response regulator [Microcoleus sp. bin38.metabat.b11b12b14.051]|uniref:response regulator n=1 Tax=Microcoleus sp. bin38.metabat.b11b12b14.051 TaxID=2742709 RepID=UPI0025F40786|nr:response regulator [Microcoleus sp. bin38.metabat.b11b12b14.051]
MKHEDKLIRILVIEDSDEDFEAFMRVVKSFAGSFYIDRCTDGDTALDFLFHEEEYADPTIAPRPNLILLDLNLPGTDGREVLVAVRNHEKLKLIPIVVFTTSSNQKDVKFCYSQGANGYILKQMGLSALTDSLHTLFRYWFEFSILPELL